MIDEQLFEHRLTDADREFLKESYRKINIEELKKREYPDMAANGRMRNDYHRDYTRVLYSSSFRRMQGKMQILGIQTDAFFRNRLTHSLEVAQIARSIAAQIGEALGGDAYSSNNDLYLIEAAALAHDIGHPAFGHCGEHVLDKLEPTIRFEGNAQNFRVLRMLEKKIPEHGGLNMTNRTLLAINKYVVREDATVNGEKVGKFMYADDYDFLMDVRRSCGLEKERTLDAQIIDVADEIAYAVHDLEDALSIGFFNINELSYLLGRRLKDDNDSLAVFEVCVKRAEEISRRMPTSGSVQEYSQIFYKELASGLTNVFINDIGVVDVNDKMNIEHGTSVEKEIGFVRYKELARGLKNITFECINRNDSVALYEQHGETVLKGLYTVFTDTEYNRNNNLLPPEYRPRPDAPKTLPRAVIDYLSGMMDTFAISLYEKHFGVRFDNIKYISKK